MKLKFLSKAKTLYALEKCVTKSKVLPQLSFTVSKFLSSPNSVLEKILERFSEPLIVRSSALSEDTLLDSKAGMYLSVQNVLPKDVLSAIKKVQESFLDYNPKNEIFVQPMLNKIFMSGVLFTIDPNTNGNYFVINYDISESTKSVTSGTGQNLHTCYLFHHYKSGDKNIDRLVDAAKEIMKLFDWKAIDIEFAFTSSDELYILQVRPLVIKTPLINYEEQKNSLARIENFLKREMRPKLFVKGKKAIFSIMSDWNPAEMIGLRPKPLSLSIYKKIITDQIWANQRNKYGYEDLRDFPLMVSLCGLPYIDVRLSFNSFIPKNLDNDLKEKLANYYLTNLTAHPEKHDKIEFDIVFSCYTFDLQERIQCLNKNGFSVYEQKLLTEALKELTNNLINKQESLATIDLKKVNQLQQRYEEIMGADINIMEKIFLLLKSCAEYGTLPFAGLARAGFIAVQLLKSMVSIGILSNQDYHNYMSQLNTVGSEMRNDQFILSECDFIKKYGHLRPGTYDINAPRYDDPKKEYIFNFNKKNNFHDDGLSDKKVFKLSESQNAAIQIQMEAQSILGDVDSLFDFIKKGIEGREYSKFIFTKSLSAILEMIALLGAEYGFTREDMAYLDISVINQLYSNTDDIRLVLENSINEGRKKYFETLSLSLPPIILNPDDIYYFHLPQNMPNFITTGNVSGLVCKDYTDRILMKDKIVMIPAADPGFDYIFLQEIRGFITAYGGPNSHMAIRAAQLGIPAVIGAGEKLFNQWSQAQTLKIDCISKKVSIIL